MENYGFVRARSSASVKRTGSRYTYLAVDEEPPRELHHCRLGLAVELAL
jgi:hypothetical protein